MKLEEKSVFCINYFNRIMDVLGNSGIDIMKIYIKIAKIASKGYE